MIKKILALCLCFFPAIFAYTDFSYMPTELATFISNNDPDSRRFNDSQRETILSASPADRIALYQSGDRLIQEFMGLIVQSVFNQYASIFYNPAGTNQFEFWVIQEGVIDPLTNLISSIPVNLNIFKLFIGLAYADNLSGAEETLQDAFYTALNNDNVSPISVRKRVRIVKPVL